MKYVVSLNGDFVDDYQYKQAAITRAKWLYESLEDKDKNYSFVTVDEVSEVNFAMYKLNNYDDEYLQNNSKLILEL